MNLRYRCALAPQRGQTTTGVRSCNVLDRFSPVEGSSSTVDSPRVELEFFVAHFAMGWECDMATNVVVNGRVQTDCGVFTVDCDGRPVSLDHKLTRGLDEGRGWQAWRDADTSRISVCVYFVTRAPKMLSSATVLDRVIAEFNKRIPKQRSVLTSSTRKVTLPFVIPNSLLSSPWVISTSKGVPSHAIMNL